MNITAKIFANAVTQVVSKILGTILGLVAIGVITRYLSSDGFGRYTTATTFASIFAVIADLGLALVSSQMLNKKGADEQKVIANLFAFRLVSASLIVGLAPVIVKLFPYDNGVKAGVWLAAICFVFTNFNQIFVALFQKHLRTDKIAIAEVSSRLVLAVLAVVVAKFNFGLAGVLWAMVIANALSFAMHYYMATKFVKIGLAFDKKIWQEILVKAWPLLTTIVLNLIYLKADTFILTLMKTDREVGLYGSAYKVIDVLVSLPYMFAGIVLPLLVNAWTADKKQEFNQASQRFFDFMSLTALPLMVGGMVLADSIMQLIAGPDFAEAGPILSVLMLAVGAVFMSCYFTHLMVAAEKQKKMIPYFLITALTSLPLYFLAIKNYGCLGAASITVYSETVILLGSIIAVKIHIKEKIKLTMLKKTILSSATMGAVLWLMKDFASFNPWYLLFTIAIGSLIYFTMVFLLGGLSKEEIKSLLSKNQSGPTVNNL